MYVSFCKFCFNRYVDLQPVGMGAFGLVWYVCFLRNYLEQLTRVNSYFYFSSAKDQLTGTNVAIKKIMKPFSTPVLSKRTYRELKLLKHLKHENVVFLFIFLIKSILIKLLNIFVLILSN